MQRKIRLSVRHDITNRAEKDSDFKKLGSGWTNVELTTDELIRHVQSGFPIAHQFIDGNKNKQSFLCADLLIADIDNKDDSSHFSIDDAVSHPFVTNHASFIYTTPSHSDSKHRFRIIFELDSRIFNPDVYEAMYAELLKIIPTDPATKSVSQMFFGSKNCQIIRIDKRLDDVTSIGMVNRSMERQHVNAIPSEPEIINKHTIVKTKHSRNTELWSLADGTSIHCPFGTHLDKNASAFVKSNKQGIKGVECRSCGHSSWTELPTKNQSLFTDFDRYVTKHAGEKNTHFDYQGLGLWNPEMETDLGSENFHIINNPHVGVLPLVQGIHLIKSPKGTGKTEALRVLIETFKNPSNHKKLGINKESRFILVGHRQSLIRQSAERLGMDCYLDTGAWDTKITDTKNTKNQVKGSVSTKPQYYAICLDSLHSRINFRHEKYDVLIIDESEQVFSHFMSEHMKHPTNNFHVLSDLIKQSKYVYCLDADLDRITMTGVVASLCQVRTNRFQDESKNRRDKLQKIYFHLNTFIPHPRETSIFESKQHLLDDFRLAVQSGKRCLFVSNSKKFVEEHYESFRKAFQDKKFELVTSESGADPEVRKFIKNIKTEILNRDVVFGSPTIGTGVDITFPNNEEHIDCVYGFFESSINTHFDIDQQLYRVRHPKEVKVWINPKTFRHKIGKSSIRKQVYETNSVPGLRYEIDVNGIHLPNSDDMSHPFQEVITEVIAVRRSSMNNLRTNFINHRKNTGWIVNFITKDEVQSKKGSVVAKAGRVSRKQAIETRLLSSRKLSFKEEFRLNEKKGKNEEISKEDQDALSRYWIETFYKTEITADLIKLDNGGKFREQILILESVIDSQNPHISLNQLPEYTRGIPSSTRVKVGDELIMKSRQLKMSVFLRESLGHAGIFDTSTLQFQFDTQYSSDNLKNFVEFLKIHQDFFEFVFDKPINEHLDTRPASQVGSFLRLIGLDQKAVKLNKGSKSGPSIYSLDPVRYQQTMGIVNSR